MQQSQINIAVEGYTDEIVVRSILDHIGLSCGLVRGKKGKIHLLNSLSKYNQAARFAKWLIVVDLDQDADCAPDYVISILSEVEDGLILRIAVRAIESWLLADREHLAKHLGIAIANVPLNPDAEDNPKNTLLALTRKSRRKALKEDIIPRLGSGARVGPGYAFRINEFVTQSNYQWRPDVAVSCSDSLRRCIGALQS